MRKFYLTLVTAIVAAGAGLAQALSQSTIAALGVVIVLFTAVFWGLDTHYHGYLRVAAKTAQNIEEELKLAPKLRVTAALGSFRDTGAIAARVFHLIYAIPASAALVVLTIYALVTTVPQWFWAAIAVSFIMFVFTAMLFVLVAEAKVKGFIAGASIPPVSAQPVSNPAQAAPGQSPPAVVSFEDIWRSLEIIHDDSVLQSYRISFITSEGMLLLVAAILQEHLAVVAFFALAGAFILGIWLTTSHHRWKAVDIWMRKVEELRPDLTNPEAIVARATARWSLQLALPSVFAVLWIVIVALSAGYLK